LGNRCDLGGALSLSHDDLGESLPERPVVVYLGETEIFER